MFTHNNIILKQAGSTNSYALELKSTAAFKEGLVVTADFQTGGKGQRGKEWESRRGENLLLSAVIESNISIDNQFDLNILSSLAIMDCLKSYDIDSQIKWPNDILVNKCKIAGILIQNLISKNIITHTVIGIGLNLNQIEFTKFYPSATSIQKELGATINISDVKDSVLNALQLRLENYRLNSDLKEEYLSNLFQKDKVATFESNNQKFMGIIRRVTKSGLLQIETENSLKEFNLQEVKMLF
ncbi:biotin--[acetyl-CoA-carboxylase] ligase [Flavobacteriales bacterium]|nr:biotin--[acetyl-CoA-carboxylase] ligase [Flavobacteriales bacterium]